MSSPNTKPSSVIPYCSTSADTLAYLEKYAADGFADRAEVELLQNRVPKILADGLSPASCPEQPELEWCPPGHGDLYPALLGSGWLDRLLEEFHAGEQKNRDCPF